MIIKNVNLETVCGITSAIPDNLLDEVAFAGKSNVGKSSLINALMNRKSYARISATPGKTQTINFYNINEELYLVDLPGYGYAKVSEKEKIQWGNLIERYLHTSKQLKAVFLLIDIRHDPSANDKMMYQWIVDQGFQPIIIATKLDKLKRSQVQKHVKMLKTGLNLLPGTKVIPFSSVTKQGRDEIWDLAEREYLFPERFLEDETKGDFYGAKETLLASGGKSYVQYTGNGCVYYPGRKSNRISHAVRCGLDHFCHCDTSGELAGKAIEDRKEAGNSNDCYHGHWADRFSGIFCSQQDCSGSDRSDSELSGYLCTAGRGDA